MFTCFPTSSFQFGMAPVVIFSDVFEFPYQNIAGTINMFGLVNIHLCCVLHIIVQIFWSLDNVQIVPTGAGGKKPQGNCVTVISTSAQPTRYCMAHHTSHHDISYHIYLLFWCIFYSFTVDRRDVFEYSQWDEYCLYFPDNDNLPRQPHTGHLNVWESLTASKSDIKVVAICQRDWLDTIGVGLHSAQLINIRAPQPTF